MTRDEVLDIFRQCDALLEGHFILSSGLHSPVFLQKALVFRRPAMAEKLCKALAQKIRAAGYAQVSQETSQEISQETSQEISQVVSQVVSPAMGGVIPGYETARHLGLPAIYTERVEGVFQLRRGFEIAEGEKVIIVEDIVSTGLSIRECVDCVERLGGDVVAAACLVDRSGGEADVGVPLVSLTQYKVPAFEPDNLPPELAALPAVKPGSRGLS